MTEKNLQALDSAASLANLDWFRIPGNNGYPMIQLGHKNYVYQRRDLMADSMLKLVQTIVPKPAREVPHMGNMLE